MGLLSDIKSLLADNQDPAGVLKKISDGEFCGLSGDELTGSEPDSLQIYQGKVRQCISHDGDLYLLHTDNLSAFDRFVASVPLKGSVLAAIATYWHKKAAPVMPSALISQPHERILRQKHLKPVMAEVIVRAYLAGSMLREYQQGKRNFCGVALPEGLKPFGPLPTPIVTPTSKAEQGEHDENRSPEQLIEEGIVTEKEWALLQSKSLELFQLGTSVYGEKGWILVDTKYEFGKDADGNILLMDELHTPDSSRFWKVHSYQQRLDQGQDPEMLDKEIIRRYLKEQGYFGEGSVPPVPSALLLQLLCSYLEVAEDLCEKELEFGKTLSVGDLIPILGLSHS